jgi:hypothetical protein
MNRELSLQCVGRRICHLLGALVLTVAPVACGESGVGESREECSPKGADEMCVEVTYLGDKEVRMDVTWTYAEDKIADGVFIHEVFWSAVLDCKTNTGDLQDVMLRDAFGTEVFIAQDSLTSMWMGIQNEQVDVMASEGCKDA